MSLLEKMKQLEAEATPGPWELRIPDPIDGGDATYKVYPKDGDYFSYFISDESYYNTAPKKPDAELLVALRNALPKLLAVVEAADRLCTALDFGDDITQANRQEDLEGALAALEEDV